LRGRHLSGVEMIGGIVSADPGTWSGGSIYSPNEGKT